jgi:hypothetical protein
LQDLRGVGDPVPEAGDGFEGIVHAEGRIAEMFQLLQHRVGQAGDEGVAAQHQHRQAVGMGQRGCGQKVRRSRPGAGGAEHEALAQVVLGIGGGGKAHALFVLATVKREFITDGIKRLTQARHVAMAEDAETAAADAGLIPVDHDPLRHEPFDDGLGDGQADHAV